jgi:predicted DNA binding CopG/RHH family protein
MGKMIVKGRLSKAKILRQRITKKRGSPALLSAEKRLRIITLRLSESEFEILREKAQECGFTLSDFVRLKLFSDRARC